MFRTNPFTVLCGFLSTIVVPVVAIALGYVDVSFALPYLKAYPMVAGLSMGLMYWKGPAPVVFMMRLLDPLATRFAFFEGVQMLIFYSGVPVVAVGLTLQLMRFVNFMNHLHTLGASAGAH